ncbi:hypothetical protein WH96_17325 [Kiloniella spongiae]|uniref:Uncharacterized protein n=1 Tax=Kiloniella spongiae TaxID=1489064 RepID=A0A0H2MFB7_9PROT|nr:hypothetical protein [Kiloniella spongiae]KLN59427.1 hypothetical protein WH96_17325 [Kiloniella spongiae]
MAYQNMTASTIGSRALATALDAVSAMGQSNQSMISTSPKTAIFNVGSPQNDLGEENIRQLFVSMIEAEQ